MESSHIGGAWIPPRIYHDEDLSHALKMALGRIVSLSNREGYCWATDSWLAEDMQVSRRTLQRRLSELEERGYIERETDQSGDTTTRKITPTRQTWRTHTTDLSHGGGGHTTDLSHAISSEDTVSSEDNSKNNGANWEEMGREEQLDRSTPDQPCPIISEVFNHCREVRAEITDKQGGPPLQLTKKRHGKIRARLREGWQVEQLQCAYEGMANNDYHQTNGYLDPELAFRDDEKVRRHMKYYADQQEYKDGGSKGVQYWD